MSAAAVGAIFYAHRHSVIQISQRIASKVATMTAADWNIVIDHAAGTLGVLIVCLILFLALLGFFDR